MARIKWSDEETIVTLDFYHSHYPSMPVYTSREIQELRDTMRRIRQKLGQNIEGEDRSLYSVHMKLKNFDYCNPNHKGEGLKNASKRDIRLFKEFEDDRNKLSQRAEEIKDWADN